MSKELPNNENLVAKWKNGIWCFTYHEKTFKILILEEGEDYVIEQAQDWMKKI